MKCPKCNKELPDGVKFCARCGAALDAEQIEKEAVNSVGSASKKSETPVEKKKDSKKKKGKPIFLIVIVVLICAYFGAKFYIKKASDDYYTDLGNIYRMLTDTNSSNDQDAENRYKELGEPKKYYSAEVKDFYGSILEILTESYNTKTYLHEDILEGVYKIFDGPTNPKQADIIERISKIEGITGVEAVTKENDSNGKLNVPGGYTADIFFAHEDAKKAYDDKKDKTVAEVGTVGGGSIEIYKTFNDAVRRCNYLDLIRMSTEGQKEAIVGTCVVRISNHISDSEQDKIIEEIAVVLSGLNKTEDDKKASKKDENANNEKTADTKADEESSDKTSDDTEPVIDDDQYFTQGCRLVEQGGIYYIYPIYAGENITRIETFQYKSFPNGKGIKIATNAKVGIATSVDFVETIYGTEYPQFQYEYKKFYDVVDELLKSGHWQTIDMGYGPDTLAFEVDDMVIMNYLLLNFDSEGDIVQLMDFYTE
ncbi:zinc-ribbon domain-containing protein [Lachnospiraceae bacterium C1.1]|nr:zinc ribbon domain-containing protein [Lachnospiraceae bacterium C1.1]